jgi:hypothetical protein
VFPLQEYASSKKEMSQSILRYRICRMTTWIASLSEGRVGQEILRVRNLVDPIFQVFMDRCSPHKGGTC